VLLLTGSAAVRPVVLAPLALRDALRDNPKGCARDPQRRTRRLDDEPPRAAEGPTAAFCRNVAASKLGRPLSKRCAASHPRRRCDWYPRAPGSCLVRRRGLVLPATRLRSLAARSDDSHGHAEGSARGLAVNLVTGRRRFEGRGRPLRAGCWRSHLHVGSLRPSGLYSAWSGSRVAGPRKPRPRLSIGLAARAPRSRPLRIRAKRNAGKFPHREFRAS
jgi:hypothetical protein